MLAMANPVDLLTTADAADLLHKSVPTVNRWADEGKLPTARKLPGIRGARLFRRADVEALAVDAKASTDQFSPLRR